MAGKLAAAASEVHEHAPLKHSFVSSSMAGWRQSSSVKEYHELFSQLSASCNAECPVSPLLAVGAAPPTSSSTRTNASLPLLHAHISAVIFMASLASTVCVSASGFPSRPLRRARTSPIFCSFVKPIKVSPRLAESLQGGTGGRSISSPTDGGGSGSILTLQAPKCFLFFLL